MIQGMNDAVGRLSQESRSQNDRLVSVASSMTPPHIQSALIGNMFANGNVRVPQSGVPNAGGIFEEAFEMEEEI